MNTVIKRAEGTHSVAEYQRSSSSSSSENPSACFPHLLSQVVDNRLCGRLLLRNMISLFCTQQALFTLHRLLTVKKQTAAKQTLSAQNNRKLQGFRRLFLHKTTQRRWWRSCYVTGLPAHPQGGCHMTSASLSVASHDQSSSQKDQDHGLQSSV